MIDDLPHWVHQVGPDQISAATRAEFVSTVKFAAQSIKFVYRYWTLEDITALAEIHCPPIAKVLKEDELDSRIGMTLGRYVVLMVYGGIVVGVDVKVRGPLMGLFRKRKRGEISMLQVRRQWPIQNGVSTDIVATPASMQIWRLVLIETLRRHTYKFMVPYEPFLVGSFALAAVIDDHNTIPIHFIDATGVATGPPTAVRRNARDTAPWLSPTTAALTAMVSAVLL